MKLRAIHPDASDATRVEECQLCGFVEKPEDKKRHSLRICNRRLLAQRNHEQREKEYWQGLCYRWAEALHGVMEEAAELPQRRR